jgi:hypothetical protein
MTTTQLLLLTAFYFALMIAVIYFTRAKTRRLIGAVTAGVVFAFVGLFGFMLGETQRWWQMPKAGVSYFYPLFWLGLAVSCVPTYLMLWRIVRRFGTRGLVICILVTTIIGPPRDYWIVSMFPAWMTFSPGIAPILADAAIYTLLIVVGYAVMRIVAGPAQSDSLVQRSA